MKKYFPFIAKYRTAMILGPLLAIIDVFGEIVQPMLMSDIVDIGIKNGDVHYILKMGATMIGLSLVAIVGGVGNVYFSSKSSVGFASELRKGLFSKIQEFSFANIDTFSSASLVTRLTNDVNTLQQVAMMSLRLLIRAPLMLICAVIFALQINRELTIIIAVAIPALSLAIFLILKKGIPYFTKMQQKLDKVNGAIQENLTNIRVVKSFVRSDFEKQKFAVANKDLMDMSVKASTIVVLIMPVMMLIMNISIVAVVWFGGNKVMQRDIQVGQLMSFISYITQILIALMLLSMTIMMFSRATASSKRIMEVLETKIDIKDNAATADKNSRVTKGKVEFRDVCFKYNPDSETFVLKDISFTASPGELIAIIGATGSAKTSLVQLIPRLYDATEGQVLIDDQDVRNYTLHHLREATATVLQKNVLFSGTIKSNLKWGDPEASDEAIIAAAKDAQAHDFVMSFPLQYETILGQGGVNLSGGQQQRLCIARALIKKPTILILDDSTSAVDTATEAKIREALQQNHSQTTTFIIAQRISSIETVDRIIIIDDGRIIGVGTHNELLKDNAVYQEIYQSQQQNEVMAS
ncbi:ABC transporter ATP-binding protein [Dyadobacter psychrotolerans]|uniref:ABC transporter ATP-binding protein n=1 Tax=Dyadobacter psychrotolerans TaxID=2541721 RepID=A0A4R5DWL7_9BACT|nr:ABC transporter ATP-binding protein [Dyadobacter psychrotolerans]TDE16810.1 ABC transporter ATP-binding protein [Dyadobacter psychrotolerans]